MPISGGPSSKAGNSFERRWTVFTLIEMLEGRYDSIRIEVPGENGVGAEFRVISNGIPEWHQAKRQRDAGPWTIANMAREGVLAPWWPKLQNGGRCVFVSTTGAQELRELVERAADAQTWDEFSQEYLSHTQDLRFQRLRHAWGDPAEDQVYEALQRIKVWILGEPELAGYLEARLAVIVTGVPGTAAAVLAQLVDESCHRELAADEVWDRLAANGITSRHLVATDPLRSLRTYLSTVRDRAAEKPRWMHTADVELVSCKPEAQPK